jgi:hypothetical protein
MRDVRSGDGLGDLPQPTLTQPSPPLAFHGL